MATLKCGGHPIRHFACFLPPHLVQVDSDPVARGVVCMATLPLEANVQFMTVMATKKALYRPRLT